MSHLQRQLFRNQNNPIHSQRSPMLHQSSSVSVYAGSSIPTGSFPTGFNFGEPAVLAQNWNSASVFISTAAALGLLGIWGAIALAARRWSDVVGWPRFRLSRMLRSLAGGWVAGGEPGGRDPDDQPRLAGRQAQAQSTTGFVAATGLKPPDQRAGGECDAAQLVPKEHFVNAVTWGATVYQIANMSGPAVGGILFTLPLAGAVAMWNGAPMVYVFTLADVLGTSRWSA